MQPFCLVPTVNFCYDYEGDEKVYLYHMFFGQSDGLTRRTSGQNPTKGTGTIF